jgi:putative redox protein
MDAKAVWKGRWSFEGSVGTGFSLPVGSRSEAGGEADEFSPMELILIGVAGCTAMDVISILQKKRQDVTEFTVSAHGDRAEEHPRVFTRIHIEYQVTGRGLDPAAVERAVELSETKYCPAHAMISRCAGVTHSITLLETEGG